MALRRTKTVLVVGLRKCEHAFCRIYHGLARLATVDRLGDCVNGFQTGRKPCGRRKSIETLIDAIRDTCFVDVGTLLQRVKMLEMRREKRIAKATRKSHGNVNLMMICIWNERRSRRV